MLWKWNGYYDTYNAPLSVYYTPKPCITAPKFVLCLGILHLFLKRMDRRVERAEEVSGQHQCNSGHNQTHLDRAIGQSGKKIGPRADLRSSSRISNKKTSKEKP